MILEEDGWIEKDEEEDWGALLHCSRRGGGVEAPQIERLR